MAGEAPAAPNSAYGLAWRLSTLSLALVGVVGACGLIPPTSQPTKYAESPEALGRLSDERIAEASGIAASRRNPGLYYVHNDSGDVARVFLVDRDGRTRLTIRLKGAQANDCEDIALAPSTVPGTFDVCVADIGDNKERRPNVSIYRFPEVALEGHDGTTLDVDVVAYRIRYADGPANAEAFAVHPRTGNAYILTKRIDGRSLVYKLTAPWDPNSEVTLPKVCALELPPALPIARVVTAADISPDGERLAVRCYDGGWEWRLPAGTADADFERIFKAAASRLPLAPERQGEAICYAADGAALLTVSEGASPTLWELRAAP